MSVNICRGKWVYDTRIGDHRIRRVLDGATTREAAEELARNLMESGKLFSFSERPRYSDYRPHHIRELWRKTKERAAARGIEFDLTEPEAQNMFSRSGGGCEITGIAFDRLFKPEGAGKRPFAASIDRIDCKIGYTAWNCRLVLAAVNVALGEWGIDVFSLVAHAFVKRRKA